MVLAQNKSRAHKLDLNRPVSKIANKSNQNRQNSRRRVKIVRLNRSRNTQWVPLTSRLRATKNQKVSINSNRSSWKKKGRIKSRRKLKKIHKSRLRKISAPKVSPLRPSLTQMMIKVMLPRLRPAGCQWATIWNSTSIIIVAKSVTIHMADGWITVLSTTGEMDVAHALLCAPTEWSWKSGNKIV